MMFPFVVATVAGLACSLMKNGQWGYYFPVMDAQGYPGGCDSFHGIGVTRCEHAYCQLLRNARRGPGRARRMRAKERRPR